MADNQRPKRVYINSPVGTAAYVWLNKPDTKFNADGVYKVDLAVGGEDARKFSDLIVAEAKAALARYWETPEGSKVPPGQRSKWSTYLPFKDDEDEEGNATGYVVFKFKQNAKIKLKDGTVKDVVIAIRDAKNKNDVRKAVFSGSELRVAFSFRAIVMKQDKHVGVQLAIGWVNVWKLAEPEQRIQSADNPFGDPDDAGYDASNEEKPNEAPEAPTTGGDY